MTLRGEGCEDPRGITDERQARGIVTMHSECRPPCVRGQAAAAFLANLRTPTEP